MPRRRNHSPYCRFFGVLLFLDLFTACGTQPPEGFHLTSQQSALNIPDDRFDNINGHPQLAIWPKKVQLAMDQETLSNITLPSSTAVYVMQIIPGVEGPAYVVYDAGMGAFSQNYWPASAIKVLSALASLERLALDYRFSGEAVITYGLGGSYNDVSLRSTYQPAIQVSDNAAYSRTLQVAGATWINVDFFKPERGFPLTLLQRTYVAGATYNAMNRPEITIVQNGQTKDEPARQEAKIDPPPGCSTDGATSREQNCANLFEMIEGLRRIMMHAEIMEFERFVIDDTDVQTLQDTLCATAARYFDSAANSAMGGVKRNCHKTGWVPDYHCLDHAYLEGQDGSRALIGVATPYTSPCSKNISPVGVNALTAVVAKKDGMPLQFDAGDLSVRWTANGANVTIDVEGSSGNKIETWIDKKYVLHDGTTVQLNETLEVSKEHLLVARLLDGSNPIAYRALIILPSDGSGCDDTLKSGPGCASVVEEDGGSGDDGSTGSDNDGSDSTSNTDETNPKEDQLTDSNGVGAVGSCGCATTHHCEILFWWMLVGLCGWRILRRCDVNP